MVDDKCRRLVGGVWQAVYFLRATPFSVCLLGGTLLRDNDMREHHQQGLISLRANGRLYDFLNVVDGCYATNKDLRRSESASCPQGRA